MERRVPASNKNVVAICGIDNQAMDSKRIVPRNPSPCSSLNAVERTASDPQGMNGKYHTSTHALSRSRGAASFLIALVIGVALMLYLIPLHSIFATDSISKPVAGDAAMNVIGQRYFVADRWRWPPFLTKQLVAPDGTNIAFTDSIPLIAFPTKLLRSFLPSGFHSIFLWLAICWVAQPIAAVFALRSAGEERIFPNLSVALIAVSMPTFLNRTGHSALCGHFLILIAVGLYFRIVRSSATTLIVTAGILILAALLVEPYIMYIVSVVIAAAPLSLLLRRDGRWRRAAAGVTAGITSTGLTALALGYGRALPMPGFGYYSMNLLSPLYPGGSAFFSRLKPFVDATGGQYEGYQYLGVGLLLLVSIALLSAKWRCNTRILRQHAGLVAVCGGMTLLALSTKVYAGSHLLLNLGSPKWLLQFRTTGRFFWPVAYVLVIGSVGLVCRRLSYRMSVLTLMFAASLQFIEASTIRAQVKDSFHSQAKWQVDTAQLRPLLAKHSKLTVWPTFLCGADHQSPTFLQLFLLASEVPVSVNTMYVGRVTRTPTCDPPALPIRPSAGQMLVFLPEAPSGTVVSVVDWQDICRQIGTLIVCSQALRDRSDLQRPEVWPVPLNAKLPTSAHGEGTKLLGFGWSNPETWGVWSQGQWARLVIEPATVTGGLLKISIWAHALGVHPENSQEIAVFAEGRQVASWHVTESGNAEFSAVIPSPSKVGNPTRIDLHIAHPISPRLNRMGADDRQLGLGLVAIQVERLAENR